MITNLKTLVMMQLKDKMDLSFVKSKRSLLFKIAAIVGQVAFAGGAFFGFFYLASYLKLFSFSGLVPDTLLTAMFTLIFVLAVITCTLGLTETLYLSADNRVLLTLPVQPNLVFLSKFVMYFIFELKKNAMLLLPMYIAYGIVCHAVWYFYPWLIICYFFVSLLPVAIAAVISMPALFVSNFVRNHKWLQAIIALIVAGVVGWGLVTVIGLMPENIDIAGRWGIISAQIQQWLRTFAGWVKPLEWINLMIMGGDAAIRYRLFTMNTLWGWLVTIGTISVCMAVTYLLARPLFFKMASSQFEYEKSARKSNGNPVHSGKLAPFVYEFKRSLRSSRYILRLVVSLLVLPIAVYLLNKTYAAMNTRTEGDYMTFAFSLLVALLIVTSDNVRYASVYSVDGQARPIAKTQPIIPQISLSSRLIPRALVILVSTIAMGILWRSAAHLSVADAALLSLIVMFVGWGHLLWSAEMDVMRPQHEQYATLGMTFNNPNERNSTILAFIISALLAVFTYLIMSKDHEYMVEGQVMGTTVKIAVIAFLLLVARVYLYFTRIRLYYAEK